MPVFDASIRTKFVDGSTDLGGKGWVLKDYIIDVYPNLVPGVKTPALWLWGFGSSGQLGNNTIGRTSSPVQTIAGGMNWKQVSCGSTHTACVKTDGTLWLWGSGGSGELGDNTVVGKSSPVQTITGGTNWAQVACGNSYTAAIKTDGTLWLWGANSGQLGDNTVVGKSSPVQTITGGTDWRQVSCGVFSHTAAVKTDGTLWLWGPNNFGRLGDGTASARSSPVQTVTGGTNWAQVACGRLHTLAVKTDGTLWAWGLNTTGQLGDNTAIAKSSPVQTITGGTNWKQVSCGYTHTACVKTDGTLWLWGSGGSGELGDNTVVGRSSPTQTITRGSTWKQVALGYDYTACIKADGTLWMWGRNQLGQLGNNTLTSRSSPVQTIALGFTWKQVACPAASQRAAAIADGNY